MTTISARVDEALKDDAEKIANTIGLSLSSIINVFLRRFVMENGFPFELKAKPSSKVLTQMSTEDITALIKQSIRESSDIPKLPTFTYLDPLTNIPRIEE